MSESRTATEVPEALKRLVRYVLDGFYSEESKYIMELLIHHPCIKEDDLARLTKFDKKRLRACLNSLKLDQFIGCRMQMETGEDKKALKHNYYFIRYTLFINVVKYKLHCMREKIEAKEKEAIYRDTFKCLNCLKTFNDLDAGDLFDTATGTFKCTLCSNVVEEQTPDKDEDCTNLMAVFNEEMKPIYDCLEEIDNIKLDEFILNPIPIKDLQSRTAKRSLAGKSSNGDNSSSWGGEVTSNISIKNADGKDSNSDQSSKKKKQKDRSLIWMKQNTIQSTFQDKSSKKSSGMKQISSTEIEQSGGNNSQNNQDIIKTLLSHEKAANDPLPSNQTNYPAFNNHHNEQNDSNADENDNEMDDDDDEDEDDNYYVTIAGAPTHYDSITPDMLESMSQEEKEEYIRVGRKMHEYFD